MVSLSIGYPTLENQMKIIRLQRYSNPLLDLKAVTDPRNILEVQNYLTSVKIADPVLSYAISLCEESRRHSMVDLGISPRGVAALVRMSKANAVLKERNYVIPEDLQNVFCNVCAHRLVLRPQARVEGIDAREILTDIMDTVKPPAASER